MQRRIRLLVSARDPGAALSAREIVRLAMGHPRFDVRLVASEPAYSILKDERLCVQRADAVTVASLHEAHSSRLFEKMRALVRDFDPHAVLVGLSSPGAGLDEMLLALADGRLTYAVQDFWGDINFTLGVLALTYFVIDAEAARLTRLRADVRTVRSGFVKYASYAELDALRLREESRAALGLNGDTQLIGFFGQPLWRIPGYAETLSAFGESKRQINDRSVLIYRPHPKESYTDHTEAARVLRRAAGDAFVETALPTRSLLAACDIVVSCFSSCGYDGLMLNRFSPVPLASVVYLMFEPGLRDWFQTHTGLSEMPPARDGLALSVTSIASLDETLLSAGCAVMREKLWSRVKERITDPRSSSGKILETIATDLDAMTPKGLCYET